MRYYADDDHSVAHSGEVRPAQPYGAARIEAVVLRNGHAQPDAAPALQSLVQRVVESSGALQIRQDAQAPLLLRVTVDDSTSGSAVDAGDRWLTTLSFGLATPKRLVSTDRYRFTIALQGSGVAPRYGEYEHALWSAVGHGYSVPSTRGPYRHHDEAYAVVVEDVVLGFLKDLDNARTAPSPVLFVPAATR